MFSLLCFSKAFQLDPTSHEELITEADGSYVDGISINNAWVNVRLTSTVATCGSAQVNAAAITFQTASADIGIMKAGTCKWETGSYTVFYWKGLERWYTSSEWSLVVKILL